MSVGELDVLLAIWAQEIIVINIEAIGIDLGNTEQRIPMIRQRRGNVL